MKHTESVRNAGQLGVPPEPPVLDIVEMDPEEMTSLLARSGYGHLGCARFDKPYVVPIHYLHAPPDIYLYTTRGMKTELLDANSQVCLQVEEIRDSYHWMSVIVSGYANRLTDDTERQQALNLIQPGKPDLGPAMAHTHFGELMRSSTEVIYKIRIHHMTGRKTKQT
jgi:uncharacterized protein